MSEIKLLPCPFCGGEAKFHRSLSVIGDIVTVRCKACQAKTAGILFDARKHQSDEEYDEAAALWNNRKPIDDVLERLETLVEKCMINSEKATELGQKYEKHIVLNDAKRIAFEQAIEIIKEELM